MFSWLLTKAARISFFSLLIVEIQRLMTVKNPLHLDYDSKSELELLDQALQGNKEALNALMANHSEFIYNISIKMVGSIEDAEDITQDILIKIITNLSSYDVSKAQFRTWIYRITINHILNLKKSSLETRITSFESFFDTIDQIADEDIPASESDYFDPLSEELKIKCMSGMLMCLPREDRLLYVMGDLFNMNHTTGSEVFGLSKDGYRKRLSRVRNDLKQWMNNRCGLINKENPCRCRKKTKGFIKRGIVNPQDLIWDKGFQNKIHAYAEKNIHETLIEVDKVYTRLYQDHPFKEQKKSDRMLETIIDNKYIRKFLDL